MQISPTLWKVLASGSALLASAPAFAAGSGNCPDALRAFGAGCGSALAFVQRAAARLQAGAVEPLRKDIYIYNYTARMYGIPKDAAPPFDYNAVASTLIGYYFYPSSSITGLDSVGYYGAVDSEISFGNGGDDYLLRRIELPKGMAYVNIYRAGNLALPPELRDAAFGLGCRVSSWRELLMQDTGELCRRLGTQVIVALSQSANVRAIYYPYHAGNLPIEWGCRSRENAAFVLTDETLADPARMASFSRSDAEAPPTDPSYAERVAIRQIYDLFPDYRDSSRTLFYRQYTGAQLDVAAWAKRHLLGCD